MKKEIKTRVITETVYIANDGTEFSKKNDCEYHEWKTQAVKVYTVSRRGQRSDELEIYSTQELAASAVSDSAIHIITEVYLDQRVWKVAEDGTCTQDARKYFFETEGYMGSDSDCITLYNENNYE